MATWGSHLPFDFHHGTAILPYRNHFAQAERADRLPRSEDIMSNSTVKLTYECVEQLHAWVRANCPCAMENEEFIPGLICIVEMEVETALNRRQSQQFQNLYTPSMQ